MKFINDNGESICLLPSLLPSVTQLSLPNRPQTYNHISFFIYINPNHSLPIFSILFQKSDEIICRVVPVFSKSCTFSSACASCLPAPLVELLIHLPSSSPYY
ncbi:unnamed protein product [Citrullus colocynthis]|uniref:Uncharacterized protein n=1 Tax=Citrullus colocynthis TaxID=252529 RepID=A0ABP0Z2G3_9ROSI